MADDIAAVATAFGNAAVFRCPPADNRVVVAVQGDVAADDDMRAGLGALDARFEGALSFDDLLRNRE
jgi:hypothetical protein